MISYVGPSPLACLRKDAVDVGRDVSDRMLQSELSLTSVAAIHLIAYRHTFSADRTRHVFSLVQLPQPFLDSLALPELIDGVPRDQYPFALIVHAPGWH